jgi:hypothetical protein
MSKRRPLLTACLLLPAAPASAGNAEDAGVKAVGKLGGTVTCDEADPAHPVVGVNFAFVAVSDAQLKHLAAVKELRSLDLALCLGVTDSRTQPWSHCKDWRL